MRIFHKFLAVFEIYISRNPEKKYFPDFSSRLHFQLIRESTGVLHVGAHIGQERESYANAETDVIWFEAIPDVYEQLLINIGCFPNQKAICALLGDKDHEIQPFYISSNSSESSSIFNFKEKEFSGVKMTKQIQLEMVRMDSILSESDVQKHNHLVVDVQGAELKVLLGMGKLLTHIQSIQTEVSTIQIYENAVLYQELRSFLSKNGFMPLWEPEIKDHTDILFVRKSNIREAF